MGVIFYNVSILFVMDLLNFNINWNNVGGSLIDFFVFMINVIGEKYWVVFVNGFVLLGVEWLIFGVLWMYGLCVKVCFGN